MLVTLNYATPWWNCFLGRSEGHYHWESPNRVLIERESKMKCWEKLLRSCWKLLVVNWGEGKVLPKSQANSSFGISFLVLPFREIACAYFSSFDIFFPERPNGNERSRLYCINNFHSPHVFIMSHPQNALCACLQIPNRYAFKVGMFLLL